jgi:hypothetical protein
MGEILELMYTVIPADGYNRGYQRAILDAHFPYYYARFYGFPDSYSIRYRMAGTGDMGEKAFRSVTGADLGSMIFERPIPEFELIPDPPAAILKVSHFSYYRPEQEARFKAFIDSVFLVIKETQTLNMVLDLRGNDGGNPFCAAHVLSYIAQKPVPYFERPYGKYSLLAEPIPPAGNSFKGELCILTDEKCFSTTGHLAALLKYHDIGTLIGSETGGTYTCNDAKKMVILKNTGLNLQIARGTFAVAVQNMDRARGVIPDLQIDQSVSDLIQGKDTVLEYALKLLRD